MGQTGGAHRAWRSVEVALGMMGVHAGAGVSWATAGPCVGADGGV